MKNNVNMLVLWHDTRSAQATGGQLYLNGKFQGYILEDTVRSFGSKVPKETAIWTDGIYKVIKTRSPKFGWCLSVEGVPFFKYIRMHSGVSHKHTDGCLLLSSVRNKRAVTLNYDHKKALKALYDSIDDTKPIYLAIVDRLGEGVS